MKYDAAAAADRFWRQVDARQPDGCWLWTGYCKPNGYGQFGIGPHKARAHRFAYELVVGPIPEDLTLDHLCRNRACVNPAHLEPVTLQENITRGEIARGGHRAAIEPATHCAHGHEYTPENTGVRLDGGRRCRQCANKRTYRTCDDCGGPCDRSAARCLACYLAKRGPEALIAAIQLWAEEHGGVPPTINEWARTDGWPHPATVKSRFGSWNAGLIAAGFEPRRRGAPSTNAPS